MARHISTRVMVLWLTLALTGLATIVAGAVQATKTPSRQVSVVDLHGVPEDSWAYVNCVHAASDPREGVGYSTQVCEGLRP